MARAQTVWTLTKTAGDNIGEFLRLQAPIGGFGTGTVMTTKRVTQAVQLYRQIDARNLAKYLGVGAYYKAKEVTIG